MLCVPVTIWLVFFFSLLISGLVFESQRATAASMPRGFLTFIMLQLDLEYGTILLVVIEAQLCSA